MGKIVVVFLLVAVALMGCQQMGVAKCDIPGSFSVLESKISSPATADLMFSVANFEALDAGLYSKAQAVVFFNNIEGLLNSEGVSLAKIALYVKENIGALTGVGGQRLLLLGLYVDVLSVEIQPITEKDRCLLKLHIDNQRDKILPLFK